MVAVKPAVLGNFILARHQPTKCWTYQIHQECFKDRYPITFQGYVHKFKKKKKLSRNVWWLFRFPYAPFPARFESEIINSKQKCRPFDKCMKNDDELSSNYRSQRVLVLIWVCPMCSFSSNISEYKKIHQNTKKINQNLKKKTQNPRTNHQNPTQT